MKTNISGFTTLYQVTFNSGGGVHNVQEGENGNREDREILHVDVGEVS